LAGFPEPDRKDSARESEASSLLGAPGGATRARLLDQMNVDAQLMVGHLTLVIEGVADLVEVGSGRGNAINAPGIALVVRSALEVAANSPGFWTTPSTRPVALAASSGGASRPPQPTSASTRLPVPDPERQRAEVELKRRGEGADRRGRRDRMTAKTTVVGPKGVECAALLDAAGKQEAVPKINQLVRLGLEHAECLWAAECSRAWHSLRSAPWSAGRSAARRNRSHDACFGGFGIPPHLAVGLAVLAVDHSCRLLAGWNAVDASHLHGDCLELMRRVGIA